MSTNSATEAEQLPTDIYEYIEHVYVDDECEVEEEPIQLFSEDFISGPFLSDECTVPENIFELDYSYGYDCKKYFNLVAPDESTVVFASGNLINFYNVQTNRMQFRRSYLGGGIGHITLNPCKKYSHLTVAENGDNPPIIIYEWPSMNIVGILKEGAARRFAHINYSPDGELLVSQSYEPDFLITVWQWKKWRRSPIILRKKSHVHDVYRCMFSPYVPGQITTGGSGHIKFWKMAQTFTGLKLQGDLGRFGKTEISDVVAIYPMPDEKVISGSEWGNLLVWEAGLIKIEVFRTLRRKCHSSSIMQLEYIRNRGEIWSISLDGWLRAWEYRIIDEADPPDEDRVVQMIPSYERENPKLQFMCVTKRKMHDPDDTFYYAQDGNGGIWLVDLILRVDYEPSERLKVFHAGPIADIAPCPWGPFIASLGIAGTFFVYNYLKKDLVLNYKFIPQGRALIWLPLDVDSTGSFIITGFDDGVVRVCVIHLKVSANPKLTIVQSIKPHNKPLTTFTINQSGTLFVSGAEDKTIFVCNIQNENNFITLIPIGFIPLETIPRCFTWNPRDDSEILVGCQHGTIFKFELPIKQVDYTTISYLLHTVKTIKKQFESCKSKIKQDIHIEETKQKNAAKIARKKQEMHQLIAENPGLDIDEELYLQDSESEEVLEQLYIPEVPNPVLFMMYTPENTVWLSMGGYDAGYIYEYNIDLPEAGLVKATIIYDADEIEINGYIYSPDEQHLVTSMQRGQIRVNKINEEDFTDLSDYWILSMHDNFNGRISKMCFSYDNFYFFSSGDDGNLFSYKYNPHIKLNAMKKPYLADLPDIKPIIKDENYNSYSLEETMIHAEKDKQLRLANEHKKKLRNRLNDLKSKLSTLLDRNCEMPKSLRYHLKDFIIDDRIMQALDDRLAAKIALEKRKLEYDVEKSATLLRKMREYYTQCLDVYPIKVKGINITDTVETISQSTLGEEFYKILQVVKKKVEDEVLRGRIPKRHTIVGEKKVELKKKTHELEPFLVGLSPSTIKFKLGKKLSRLLQVYREKKAKKEQRQEEWNDLYSKKPTQGVSPKADVAALNMARFGIGDYKLKSSADYKVPPDLRETTVRKYQELLETRIRAYETLIQSFNRKVYQLRDKKVALIENLKKKLVILKKIHMEIPSNRIIQAPVIPTLTPDDFPEKEMEMKMNVETDFRSSLIKKKSKEDIKPVIEDIEIDKLAFGITRFKDLRGKCREIIMENFSNFDIFTITLEVNPIKEEMKINRFIRNLYYQDICIGEMKQMIIDFDNDLKQLINETYQMRMKSSYMDLHILVLNQELIIVQEFENVETGLNEISRSKYNELLDMRDHIKRIELKIEAHGNQIDICNNQIKDLQQTFTSAAKENKFWDFLRRIFKKKYRPPKIINPDESESSSFSSESSSESEEYDTGSIDSRDIGPIRLDESVCPKGCDRELYDYTFNLRNKRHELEKEIKEVQKSIEVLKKELEHSGKKLKVCEQASKKSYDELEEYQCMKQRKLNEIPCTVVLKLSQLQHSTNDETHTFVKPSDTILFGLHAMRSLLNRVDELKSETIEERGRFRRNKMHLQRMQVDCEYMNKQIKKLREDIIEKMIIKFGNKVNIDDIEEALLKRMVQDMKLAMLKIGTEYHGTLEECRKIYSGKQTELKDIIRENTARLELYNVLNKEKTTLAKILEKQKAKKEKMATKDFSYFVDDLDTLAAVAKSQQNKIEMLKEEIKMLSSKMMPMENVKPLQTQQSIVMADEEMELTNLESFDDLYVYIPPTHEKEICVPMEKMPIDIEEDKVSDQEIEICIQELMTEIVESSMKASSCVEVAVAKILSEIIDQIPLKYLRKTSSMEFVAGLMKDLRDAVEKVNSAALSQEIAQKTTVSEDNINIIIDYILSTIVTSDKE